MKMEKLIETIPKSRAEEIRVSLAEFKASNGTVYQMVSARVFYEDGREYRPGRNGLNVKVDPLPALIAALQQAEGVARAKGLLEAAPADATEAAPDSAGEGDLTVLGGG